MPIQIPNQAIGSKSVDNKVGFEQLGLAGSIEVQSLRLSNDKTDIRASFYSLLEFTKTHDPESIEVDSTFEAQAELIPFQIESELDGSPTIEGQAIGTSPWPGQNIDEATTLTFRAKPQNQGWPHALNLPRSSSSVRHRASAEGKHAKFQIVSSALKSPDVTPVDAEATTPDSNQSQKVDFVMIDPDTSLLANRDQPGFVETAVDNPRDDMPKLENVGAIQRTTGEVVQFAVDSPLPMRSEYAEISVSTSTNAGLYSYVAASTVQDDLMTKKLQRKNLLSQTTHAIKTQFRESEDKQILSLELNPAELGHLKILIERSEDKIQAKIIASESAAKEMLSDEHDQLLQKLRDLNVGPAEIQILQSDDRSNEETGSLDEFDAGFTAGSSFRVGINLVA